MIFLGVITGMAIGIVVHSNSKTVYESTAIVRFDATKANIVPMSIAGEIVSENDELFIRQTNSLLRKK